ncbi:MAG: sialate O-acetylesterase [Planctomycetota bacterium]
MYRQSLLVCWIGLGVLLPQAWAVATPLKVFVLVGQSNMQGHARVRTLDHMGMDPRTEPMLRELVESDGTPRVFEDISIAYLSSNGEKRGALTTGYGADDDKIGPELTFGVRMRQALGEPILIIKSAWGGKSLHTDFRPPSAGPYAFKPAQIDRLRSQNKDIVEVKEAKVEATGFFYRQMINYVRDTLGAIEHASPHYDPDQGFELAGFVWFQGWNDMVDSGTYPERDQPGGYQKYSELLSHFIRDVRRDLGTPDLPFVIGVMGVNGPVADYPPDRQRFRAVHQGFRTAMAAPANAPEFRDNVAAVLTERYWDMELDGLRRREAKLKSKLKEIQRSESLGRQEQQRRLQLLRDEAFSPAELRILDAGVSNLEFHYLGCAKIISQIGVGFADALLNLRN